MKIYTGVSTNAGEKNMRAAEDRAEATKLGVTEQRKKVVREGSQVIAR